MKFLVFLALIIIIIVVIALFYVISFNKLSIIKIKMDNAEDNIKNRLKSKEEQMKKLAGMIKKVVKKKDYLKDFNSIAKERLDIHELDARLASNFELMKEIQSDYKRLKTEEYYTTIDNIEEIDQEILANKKYFNKNNNLLIKQLKGYHKIVAKINHITVKTSYETKEPKRDLL